MEDDVPLDESLEGKRVVTADGDEVGMVTGVREDVIYVDPDPGVTDTIAAKLGWDDVSESDYTLRADDVQRVTDDELHLATL